ncbi:probable phosphoglycerate mutase [Syntrophus gentianae]|uniref:Probable phosphoglycerate mutase n=1 Tax=Syntrophus gentianae TaxID=43775 RepID=A0A1H8AFQ5_9BACT|nr:histidine phosphatase family protein [Syntrophus gentianae]SEM69441.1 probable phosphoglycerate mutase [Syntrophus gentianae]
MIPGKTIPPEANMELILIRHGSTLWNEERRIQGLSDINLSDTGLDQARHLALSLKDHPISSIYSSPLIRARKTAEIINQYHQVPLYLSTDLTEMNHGDFEGLSIPELMARNKDFLRKWLADPASVSMPHGESFLDVQTRAWKVIEGIFPKGENVIVVAHNFTIASILCRIQNIPLTEFRSVCVDPASKTIIRFHHGSAYLELFNDRAYLNGNQR